MFRFVGLEYGGGSRSEIQFCDVGLLRFGFVFDVVVSGTRR